MSLSWSKIRPWITVKNIATLIACAMSVFHLYAGVFGSLHAMRQGSVHLMFALVLVFLLYPAHQGRKGRRPAFYDWVLVAASIASLGYILLNFEYIAFVRFRYVTSVLVVERVFGIMLVLVILEAARRTIGLFLTIVAALFIAYLFAGPLLPGILYHPGAKLDDFLDLQFLSDGGIFGTPLIISATYIVLFIIFGAFMLQTGFGEFVTDVASGLTGRTRGGPAKAAVVSSAAFGTISGSGSANVAVTGTFTIPMMKKVGYQPHFAGAVEATASTGGEIMPPVMGAAAFLMAKYTGVPYVQIIKFAALPAILYFAAVFFQVDLEAAKMGIRGLTKEELPPWKQNAKKYVHLIIPVVLLLYLMVAGRTPFFAVTMSILASIALSYLRRATTLTIPKLIAALEAGAKGALLVAVACALSGLIVGCIYQSGLGVRFTSLMMTLSGGNVVVTLGACALAALVLGMGMPVSPAYILLVALIIPALTQMGVNVVAAHLFAIYFCRASLVTPPVAISAYVAAGIAGAPMAKTGWTAFRLGISSFLIPFAFVYSQALLLMGPLAKVLLATVTSVIGIFSLSVSMEGFWLEKANIVQRVLAFAAAVVLIIPGWRTDLIGLALLSVVIIWQLALRRERGKARGRAGASA
jgi:TRAP transporter 4TM/12TM fusion protein